MKRSPLLWFGIVWLVVINVQFYALLYEQRWPELVTMWQYVTGALRW